MGSFNFIPLPNAIPTAAKTASGAKLETNGSLASKPKGKSFQTILTQAGEKLQTQKSENTVKFKDLPEELQKLIREKFGITNKDDIQLIKLPANAVRMDENGELRVKLEEIEPLLKEQPNTSKFQFVDFKNTEQVSDKTGEAYLDKDKKNPVLHGLTIINDDKDIHEDVDVSEEFDAIQIKQDENTQVKPILLFEQERKSNELKETGIPFIRSEIQIQGESNSKDNTVSFGKLQENHIKHETEILSKLKSVESEIVAKQDVIQLKPEMLDKAMKNPQQPVKDDSQVIYFRASESEADGLLLQEQLEITDEMAQEIAKLEKNESSEKLEYLVIKSPVQSNGDNEKPVLFLINAKDIQTEPNASQKLTVLKSDAVQAEKLQSIDGQIKVNISGSNQNGNENPNDGSANNESFDDKNDNSSKSSQTAKLPPLTESAFQLSKSLNEQAEANQTTEKVATFRAEVKSSLDQTALEMKTAAQPLQTNAVAENSGAANTTGTSTTTTVSQTLDQISTASTQQTTNTQTTAKPGVPVEIPQAYQDAAAQQIVKGVQSSLGSERSHISIHLQPESLGKVDIQLKMENGMMTAHIVAEKESTQAMLEKNATVLKTALEEKNIQIDKLHIGKDASEYRQSQQEQSRSNERWREYQQQQHEDQNRSRREHNSEQQEPYQEPQQQQQNNPWQTISNYMDRFFQRSQV